MSTYKTKRYYLVIVIAFQPIQTCAMLSQAQAAEASCSPCLTLEESDPVRAVLLPTDDAEPIGKMLSSEDQKAVELALFKHEGLIAKLCKSSTKSREDQEDLASSVRLAVCSKWKQFNPSLGSFGTWIGTIIRSEASAMRRKSDRSPKTVSCDSALDGAICEEGPSDEFDDVYDRLECLPTPYRRALACVTILGMSCREAAAVMGATEATIRTYVWRARKCLAGQANKGVA